MPSSKRKSRGTTAAAATTTATAAATGKSPRRPDPPPPPPAALVRLLQKDSKVVDYFQALQSNLDFDVQKWKTRARAHEQTSQELQTQLQNLQQQQQPRSSKKSRTSSPRVTTTNNNNTQNNKTRTVAPKTNADDCGVPIDDSMFDELSSAEEDDDDDEGEEAPFYASTPASTAKRQIDAPPPSQGGNDFALEFSSSEEDDNDDDEAEEDSKKPKPKQSSFGIHKKNTMLQVSSSDDDDNDDNDAYDDELEEPQPRLALEPTTTRTSSTRRLQTALDQLKRAESCLEQLGVALVMEEQPANLENGSTTTTTTAAAAEPDEPEQVAPSVEEDVAEPKDAASSCNNNNNNIQKKKYQRRSDQDVAIDLLQMIKALARVKYVTEGQYYYPFMTDDRLPCYTPLLVPVPVPLGLPSLITKTDPPPPHPAVQGLQSILTALCLMDAYCPALDEEEIRRKRSPPSQPYGGSSSLAVSEEDEEEERLFLGMKGRHTFVADLLQSLEGEISESWAFQDRSSRLVTVAQHYQPPQIDENEKELGNKNNNKDNNNINNNKETESEPTPNKLSTIPFGPKNFGRLAALVERCLLAKVVTSIYLFRQDYQKAFQFVWTYLLSTTPALLSEDYPKLPPVQSLCVLESILLSTCPTVTVTLPVTTVGAPASERRSSVESPNTLTLLDWFDKTYRNAPSTTSSPWSLGRGLSLAMSATACIHRTRSSSSDNRVTDVSRVELAAYQRLLDSNSHWFQCSQEELPCTTTTTTTTTTTVKDLDRTVGELIDESLPWSSSSNGHVSMDSAGEAAAVPSLLQLALVLRGDAEQIDRIFEKAMSTLRNSYSKEEQEGRQTNHHLIMSYQHNILLPCAMAKKGLEIRQLDSYRQVVNSPFTTATMTRTGSRSVHSYSADLVAFVTQLKVGTFLDSISATNFLSSAFLCCQELADGESALKLVHWFLQHTSSNGQKGDPSSSLSQILDSIERTGQALTVRVINLERRSDRMAAFTGQAIHERLMFVRGVGVIDVPENSDDTTLDGLYCGSYAIDGQGRPAEVETRLVQLVGGEQHKLNGLVETHWRPNDLKPFDTEAPNSENLVPISPSEKACALSHIASWKGVARSLSTVDEESSLESSKSPIAKGIYRNPRLVRRMLRISGYARGPSLLPSNENMDPVPVCVILEDDAILVDRFADRLSSLLEELPRDFHFCSLGYSRPKTAPMIPYSSQIGIPTSIWYLTGYILSLEGAQYLSNQLPVRGPVDSWIGLSMFANWDNVFGHAMGVGVHSKPVNEPSIPRKDLRRLLRFRAFAAMIPLCSQKVGSSASATTGRSWRQRDTDITYSGNSL